MNFIQTQGNRNGQGEPNATWRPCAPSKCDGDSNLQIKMYWLSTSKEKNLKN